MGARNFFSEEQKAQIVSAIRAAELDTSGEIRVHVETHCRAGVMNCAAYWFKQLKMHRTDLRNGVLFYLAVSEHQFAIIGDAGINRCVPENFWEHIKEHVLTLFRDGRFADGLSEGIRMAGTQLKEHFPRQPDDVNELPDELSFS